MHLWGIREDIAPLAPVTGEVLHPFGCCLPADVYLMAGLRSWHNCHLLHFILGRVPCSTSDLISPSLPLLPSIPLRPVWSHRTVCLAASLHYGRLSGRCPGQTLSCFHFPFGPHRNQRLISRLNPESFYLTCPPAKVLWLCCPGQPERQSLFRALNNDQELEPCPALPSVLLLLI